MKKKEYESPTMQVVQLKQQPTLLAGSVQTENYTWHDDIDEE